MLNSNVIVYYCKSSIKPPGGLFISVSRSGGFLEGARAYWKLEAQDGRLFRDGSLLEGGGGSNVYSIFIFSILLISPSKLSNTGALYCSSKELPEDNNM